MMKTCPSSISTSFASILLFSTLFAIFFFSFLYIQQNHIDIHGNNKLLSSKNPIQIVDHDEEDEVDSNPSPPFNASREERIEWYKNKLPSFKILESTPRTKEFDQRVHEFLEGQGRVCMVRFFMTWISPASFFGKRELLSLESVLKANPDGCVVILSRTMDSSLGSKILEPLLARGFMVLPVAPDVARLFNNTPARAWLEGLEAGRIDPGRIAIAQNLSNLLRLVVLYKYGGVYLDADVILLRNISGLRNSIGAQNLDQTMTTWKELNNAVLIFDKEHPLLLRFIEEFAYKFNGNRWGFNGPYLVSRVIRRLRNDTRFEFTILPPTAFYPVDWIKIRWLFLKPKTKAQSRWAQDMLRELSGNSYGIHLWNKDSRKLRIEEGSIIGRLISDHCILCQNVYDL